MNSLNSRRKHYQKRKEKGLCSHCDNPSIINRVKCKPCLVKGLNHTKNNNYEKKKQNSKIKYKQRNKKYKLYEDEVNDLIDLLKFQERRQT